LIAEPTEEQQEQPKLPTRKEVAEKIAARLNESGTPQLVQIKAIVKALGIVQSWALMLDAIEIDEGEGMMVPDGSRRRTVGGIFFYLAYTKGVAEPGKKLRRFPPKQTNTDNPDAPKEPVPRPEPIIPFNWEDRIAVIAEAQTEKGSTNVKITLVGQPGQIIDRGQCVVTVMESSKAPALPKGVPMPPAAPTKYTVYIGSKQWKKVSESIADPDDVLIIEGYPTMDSKTGSIAVFATNTTTKKLQMAQRTKQQATA
jgi:hypothetical protein